MIYDIGTLKKAMKARRRFVENRSPVFDFDRYYTDDFRNTYCEHIEQAFKFAEDSYCTYEGTALYIHSTKNVSTVSRLSDKINHNVYLYIQTPKSKELISVQQAIKDMIELKETDIETYLMLLHILYEGE